MPVWWSNAGLAHPGGAENNAAFVSVASKAPSSCVTIPDAAPGTWIGSSKTGKRKDKSVATAWALYEQALSTPTLNGVPYRLSGNELN